ncbi:hypothetical protein SAMN02910456_00633 [Ruminococcaceae bacterium YRB3002]|nr:hypothetical protein SAMN02910456_00633 [Ruminococcaceae bacterium YRB3002]
MASIRIEVDADPIKVDALKIYLGHKNTSLEVEILHQIESLYNKNVPSNVKDFLAEYIENEGK